MYYCCLHGFATKVRLVAIHMLLIESNMCIRSDVRLNVQKMAVHIIETRKNKRVQTKRRREQKESLCSSARSQTNHIQTRHSKSCAQIWKLQSVVTGCSRIRNKRARSCHHIPWQSACHSSTHQTSSLVFERKK